MGAGKPKQYLPLCDRVLLEWTLLPFLQAEWIDAIVVVLAGHDHEFARLPLAGHPRIVTTTGGAQRADSVLAGLRAIAKRSSAFSEVQVLVHDAARPCLQSSALERLRDEADATDGGILALPVTDTLKRAQQDRIADTVDRSQFWRAQTPQLFNAKRLMAALQAGVAQGVELTDEASAMERGGARPRLVRGSESNIKVTYPEDLQLAAFWLAQQERQR